MVRALVLGPQGANFAHSQQAHGLELLLSSTLVRVAILVGGKFSHCDECHTLGQGLSPFGLF